MGFLDRFLNWFRPKPKPTPAPLPPPTPDESGTIALLLAGHNEIRRTWQRSPFVLSSKLTNAARDQAARMASLGRVTHAPSLGDRLRAVGFVFVMAGENVAGGYRTPAEALMGWMDSDGHRANIINPAYSMVGFGRAGNFWCAIFARPV